MEILNILLKTFIGYVVLIVLMRFMGKREIGQLNLFDLVILLTIVDVLVVGIENYDDNYFIWLCPIIALGLLQKLISLLLLKCAFFRNIIDGKETLIINKGQMMIKNMKKNGYNIDDLFVQLRLKDIKNIEDVEYAILETNGELTVFKKDDNDKTFPIPLIVSGRINKDVLKYNNLNEDEVLKKIKKLGYNDFKKLKLVYIKEKELIIYDDYK